MLNKHPFYIFQYFYIFITKYVLIKYMIFIFNCIMYGCFIISFYKKIKREKKFIKKRITLTKNKKTFEKFSENFI